MRETIPCRDDNRTWATVAELSGACVGVGPEAGLPGPLDQGSVRYDPEAVAQHGRVVTSRLVLRLAAHADAAALSAILRADAEPMLGSWPYPLSPATALDKIERAIAQANRHEALAYVYSDRATGRVAGWCGAVRWHEMQDDIAMLTYWIGEDFEGRGYVAEAIRAAGPHVLAWIGASRLGAGAYPYNERSRRTMQRAGLTTPDGVRQLWSSTRERHEPIVCFAANREEVMSWLGGSAQGASAATDEPTDRANRARAA